MTPAEGRKRARAGVAAGRRNIMFPDLLDVDAPVLCACEDCCARSPERVELIQRRRRSLRGNLTRRNGRSLPR